jgi:hypothetical protein
VRARDDRKERERVRGREGGRERGNKKGRERGRNIKIGSIVLSTSSHEKKKERGGTERVILGERIFNYRLF